MSELQSLVNHLCAWVEAETAAQAELLALVEEQETALLSHRPEAVEAATDAIGRALRAAPRRAGRRAQLFAACARCLGVAPGVSTLTSIAERCGPGAATDLLRLGRDLREVTSRLARRQRRVAALIATHRRVTRDVIEHVLADERGRNPLDDEGVLVDAEA